MQNQIKPINSNQDIIQIASSEPLPAQIRPVNTIHLDLDKSGYSGLTILLKNPALLASVQAGVRISSQDAGFLSSAVITASNTLGDAFHALCVAQSENLYITPELIADFGAMLGELLPFFAHLSAELATDEARQSPNP